MNTPDRGAEAAPDYKPTPGEINTSTHFWEAFGHLETEVSAKWLCRLARQNGSWRPVSREEIGRFYTPSDGFTFNRLVEPGVAYGRPGESYLAGGGWVVERDGLFHFTEEFVNRCFLSSNKRFDELRARYPEEV